MALHLHIYLFIVLKEIYCIERVNCKVHSAAQVGMDVGMINQPFVFAMYLCVMIH